MSLTTGQLHLFTDPPGPLFEAGQDPPATAAMPRLHLVDLRFDLRRFWQALRHDGQRLPDADLGYAVHAALFGLFGPVHAPKPFHVVPVAGASVVRVLGQVALDPIAVERALADGQPAWRAALLGDVAVHALPGATWWLGKTLAFRVHARPTVRRHKDVEGKERDLELDAYQPVCERLPETERPTRDQVYCDWLRSCLEREGACTVTDVRLAGWNLVPLYRKDGLKLGKDGARRGTRGISLPQADFAGTLQVVDAERFAALVARGIGRHRAFGFGMLLLQRPAL